MQRKVLSLVAAIALIVALIPTQQAFAVNAVKYYTVRYVCICSPSCYGTIVGEWTRECDGSLYGWGVQPYDPDSCYHTDLTYGDNCD
jgi:hypothetical protein